MRYNLSKKSSTSSERIVYEILKELKIPFKFRWKVDGLEIDFLVGKYAIEIDGHVQKGESNNRLVERGLIPIHFSNTEIKKNREYIKTQLEKYVSNY